MEHTKENTIKLLEAKRDFLLKMAKRWEKVDTDYSKKLRIEAISIEDCIFIMTDKEYFNSVAGILVKMEEE